MSSVENVAEPKHDLFRNIGCWILGIIVAGNVLFEIAGLFLIGSDRNAGYAAFWAIGSIICLFVIWAYRKYAGLLWIGIIFGVTLAVYILIAIARIFISEYYWGVATNYY